MKWAHKIQIKHLLDDTEPLSELEIQAKTKEFWSIINKKIYNSFMADFIEDAGFFYTPEEVKDADDFNELLEQLYTYCDLNSIWVD